MAVLVKKNPERRYRSIIGPSSSPEEREKADQMDVLLEVGLTKLIADFNRRGILPNKKGCGSLIVYWELGRELHKVVEGNKIFEMAELPLLWLNAKLYLPDTLLYKDRGPYREHLWYCYRLGNYPKELAKKMNWSEWVTILDSVGINQEQRFDDWFRSKLANRKRKLKRDEIRNFAPCVNTLLGKINVEELFESELFNCYEAAWFIVEKAEKRRTYMGKRRLSINQIKMSIKSKYGKLGSVMDGSTKPEDYAADVVQFASVI